MLDNLPDGELVAALEEKTGAVSGMVDALRGRLLRELPGYGHHLGYDGKAVPSHSTGRRKAKTGKASDADWGRHETIGGGRAHREGVEEGERAGSATACT